MSEDSLFDAANVEALLGRPPRRIATGAGLKILEDARVLVTGAGGSVGAALVGRLAELPVQTIIALDHHEPSLFRLSRDLPGAPLDLALADLRNGPKIERLLTEKRPDVVFHLAAYKHVPLGEQGADELVAVNVLGTDSLARASQAAGVKHFVYPSSDKAVNPPSAYGSTKRIAETVLLALGAGEPSMAVHVARYVNILGSAGSFPETVVACARQGRPIPLTDEQMTRYWMGMDEAIDLVWHGLGLENGSRTILDVGDPIPTKAMAERVYRLAAPRGRQPEFVITGARPGERLFEEMASPSEVLERRGDDPVLRIVCGSSDEQHELVSAALPELCSLLACGDVPALHRRATELARQLQ